MLSSPSMRRFHSALTCFGFAALLGLAGCAQEYGARCQVNRDCADDLKCNASTKTCLEAGEVSPIDAAVDAPLDAAVTDAVVVDAATAAVDAAIDAAPI